MPIALSMYPLRQRSRGFTLVEMLAVVVLVGVLATLAVFGVIRYVRAAKTAEATSMITQIKAAEEAFREETFQYLNVSAAYTALYPFDPTTDDGRRKYSWETARSDAVAVNWRILGVTTTNPVQFAYAVVAGANGFVAPPFVSVSGVAPTGPWYGIVAQADLDGDQSEYCYVVSHSFSDEVHVENEGE